MPGRLLKIHEGLAALILVHKPQEIAIEAIFRHKSSESALRLGQARGVALLAIARAETPYFEYNAMTVKKTVTGSGRADKQQVRRMVETLIGEAVDGPNDATDAIAIAITHLVHAPRHRLLAQRR
jgi:crossover junction endodeoxyribonuclease RuvC